MDALFERYLTESELNKTLLEILAVYAAPIPSNRFERFHNELNAKSISEIRTYTFPPLVKAGFLVGEKNGYRIAAPVRELIVRQLVKENRYNSVYRLGHKIAGTQVMNSQRVKEPFKTLDDALREGRHAIINYEQFQYLEAVYRHCKVTYELAIYQNPAITPLLMQIFMPFDGEWMQTIPSKPAQDFFENILRDSLNRLVPLDEYVERYLFADLICFKKNLLKKDVYPYLYFQYLIARDETDKLKDIAENGSYKHSVRNALAGVRNFLRGDVKQCQQDFAAARRETRKESNSRRIAMPMFFECFHLLFCIAHNVSESAAWKKEVLSLFDSSEYDYDLFGFIRELNKVANIGVDNNLRLKYPMLNIKDNPRSVLANPFRRILNAASAIWCDLPNKKNALSPIINLADKSAKAGFTFLTREAKAIAQTLTGQQVDENPPAIFYKLFSVPSRWEIVKSEILSLKKKPDVLSGDIDDGMKTERLTWRICLFGRINVAIHPYTQIRNKSGWTQGRSVALSRLYVTCKSMNFLTQQDREICSWLREIVTRSYGYYSDTAYKFDSEAVLALVGHPLVFDDEHPNQRIDVRLGQPKIEVEKNEHGQFTVTLNPFPPHREDTVGKKETLVIAAREGTGIVRVFEFNEIQRKVATILTKKGFVVPKGKEDEIAQLLEPLIGDFQIHTGNVLPQLAGTLQNTQTVEPDCKIYLRLTPEETMFFIEPLVFPLGKDNGAHAPAVGSAAVFGEIDGKSSTANRKFDIEAKYLESLFTVCPVLNTAKKEGSRYTLDSLEAILEFLETLPNVDKENIIVEWAKEQKYSVSSTTSFGNLSLKLSSGTDWFEASGNLNVDGINVDLQTLLQSLETSDTRFVRLNDKQYLALTDEFRKKLDELKGATFKRGKTTAIHPLAVQAVEETLSHLAPTARGGQKAQIDFDKEWKKQIQRFKKAEEYDPAVPKTFQCEMRDYQKSGFTWLAQLSAWGAGACLADDMGLGKTIQGLALLLLRKNDGPALVVAPTSVCENWEREASRFAPVLNILRISAQTGQSSEDYKKERENIIKGAKKGDVIVTNYSLLQIEQEHFTDKKFATIILDEAQAIKNADTGRTQTAFNLAGDFRVAMTGTPIENHLGEFWSIFNFINPGFLGTKQEFEQRYANADKPTRQSLKNLIRPFLLRRTKSEVLKELPPKTEIQLDVELTKEETALYETVRFEALRKIDDAKNDNIGTQHLKVLAELMRLRRTCCHPNLVLPKNKAGELPCSKLDLLDDVVEELRENNHKALVFSQFVDYLKLIAARMDAKQISYQYLDGSMMQAKRQKAVDAFQNGESDLFLISLKAGGSGLNLTAADYVIIMDPWWNPAVENQASDRAHRIGQQRPVTIYRLITKGTIEEKIRELHEKKQALADDILDGTGTPSKLSVNDLMNLLRRE